MVDNEKMEHNFWKQIAPGLHILLNRDCDTVEIKVDDAEFFENHDIKLLYPQKLDIRRCPHYSKPFGTLHTSHLPIVVSVDDPIDFKQHLPETSETYCVYCRCRITIMGRLYKDDKENNVLFRGHVS